MPISAYQAMITIDQLKKEIDELRDGLQFIEADTERYATAITVLKAAIGNHDSQIFKLTENLKLVNLKEA